MEWSKLKMIRKKTFNILETSAIIFLALDSLISVHNLDCFFIGETEYIVLTNEKVVEMEELNKLDSEFDYVFKSEFWKEIKNFFEKSPEDSLLIFYK